MKTPPELRELLRGPVVAVTTPFKADLSLDLEGLGRLIDFYCESGIGPLIVGGSTGEFYSLTMEERKATVEVACERAAGRLPIIAGCAHSGTALALELVKHAEGAGADGVMITPPYYTFSGFEGLYRHYEIISKESGLGIVIYFSGAVLHQVADVIANPTLLYRLCELPTVAGFKDSTANHWFYRDVSLALQGIVAVMGSSGMGYYMWGWDYGSPAWITGLGNVWPQVKLDFKRALYGDDRPAARRIANEVDRPYLDYFRRKPKGHSYFAMVKALLDLVGLPGGPMRPPLLDWPRDDLPALRAAMARIGLMEG